MHTGETSFHLVLWIHNTLPAAIIRLLDTTIHDLSFLVFSMQPLEAGFCSHGLVSCRKAPLRHQFNRQPASCVARGLSLVVEFYSFFYIVCISCVKRAVSALQHIDLEHFDHIGKVER